jgi:hypothetical protein
MFTITPQLIPTSIVVYENYEVSLCPRVESFDGAGEESPRSRRCVEGVVFGTCLVCSTQWLIVYFRML